jgi:Tfp pilus assembly protein PilV
MMLFKNGQSILEVLVGIGVALVALLAIVQIANKSVTNSGFSKRQSVATAYAIEGMEWIKSQRQADTWSTFYGRGSNGGTTYCLNGLTWVAGNCSGATITGTEYIRTATLTTSLVTPPPTGPTNQQLTVTIDVVWYESGTQFSSRQETVFLRY